MNRVITLSPSENIIDGSFANNETVLVKCDATDEAFSFTMPSAVDLDNVLFLVKKIDSSSNLVTIEFNGDETLDGATSKTLPEQYDSVAIVGDYSIYFEYGAIGSNVIEDCLLKDGSTELTNDWDAGPHKITAENLTIDSLTSGRVLYSGAGGAVSDDSDFLWDDTNVRLGIGKIPDYGLDIFKDRNGLEQARFHNNNTGINAHFAFNIVAEPLANNVNFAITQFSRNYTVAAFAGYSALETGSNSSGLLLKVPSAKNTRFLFGTTLRYQMTNTEFLLSYTEPTSFNNLNRGLFGRSSYAVPSDGSWVGTAPFLAVGNASASSGLFLSTYGDAYGIRIWMDNANVDCYYDQRYAGDRVNGCHVFRGYTDNSAVEILRLFNDGTTRVTTGDLQIFANNKSLLLGALKSAGITYDSTNMVYNPKLVGTGVMLADTDSRWCFRDVAIGMYSQADGYGDMFADTAWRIGDSSAGAPTNYTQIDTGGDVSFHGTARIDWSKITADSVTLDVGTSANSVADLQTAHDGNTYDIAEVAGAPGIDLKVDFVNITAFNWVQIIAYYDGGATHSVSIQLYNWNTTSWDTFDSQDGVEKSMTDHSFFVPDDSNYIGTGGDAGKVRIRFNHTQSGNASHDEYIDVVALYQ